MKIGELAKGQTVRVVSAGLHGGDYYWNEGEEAEVRAVYANGDISVRAFSSGRRGRVSPGALEKVRPVGECPEGGIDTHDPRVMWMWEDAARVADRAGHCYEFDHLADLIGAPGRERTFTIRMFNGSGIRVTARVKARSRRLAEAQLRAAAGSTTLAVES